MADSVRQLQAEAAYGHICAHMEKQCGLDCACIAGIDTTAVTMQGLTMDASRIMNMLRKHHPHGHLATSGQPSGLLAAWLCWTGLEQAMVADEQQDTQDLLVCAPCCTFVTKPCSAPLCLCHSWHGSFAYIWESGQAEQIAALSAPLSRRGLATELLS